MLAVESWEAADTRLPYAFRAHPGAEALVVSVPKLRPGTVKPAVALGRYLGSLPVHQLYLGSDPSQFVGPRRELRGARAALSLVEELCGRFFVPPENVVFYGTSYGAVISCVLGLTAGGIVLAGAPPIDMGSAVQRWAEDERVGRRAGAAEFVALGEGDDEQSPVEWLDTLVPRMAAETTKPVRMRFVTGPSDWGYEGTLAFIQLARGLPLVDAMLYREVPDGNKHADVARAFWRLFPELLARELAL